MAAKRALELQDKRKKLVARMRELSDLAAKENRAFTAEEDANYKKVFEDQRSLKEEIDREVELEKAEQELERRTTEPARPNPGGEVVDVDEYRTLRPYLASRDPKKPGVRATAEYRSAERAWIADGPNRMADAERRALAVSTPTAGGNLVASEQFVARLLTAIDDDLFIRKLGTKNPVTESGTLGVPTISADPEDADWTAEITAVDPDTAMATGKRSMTPTLLSKLALVSRRLLRVSALPIEQVVIDRLKYKFEVTMEKAGMVGTGSSQPLGLFVASASGIPTTRDVVCASATAFTADELRNLKYKCKAQYRRRPSTGWVMHRDGVLRASLLKGSANDHYIWADSMKVGEPDTLLGAPVYESEYSPNTFTAGLYVMVYGDLSFYWWADSLQMEVQRLEEKYADTHQIGFIGRLESDGAPVMAEAFSRLRMA